VLNGCGWVKWRTLSQGRHSCANNEGAALNSADALKGATHFIALISDSQAREEPQPRQPADGDGRAFVFPLMHPLDTFPSTAGGG
jgi:hypothetical protein